MKQFTVQSCTPTKNNTFCTKLQNKTDYKVETDFGVVMQERQETYYMFTTTATTKGTKGNLDISLFDVIHKSFEIDVEGSPETIILKYLLPKKS